jgi:hypothetical protein
MKRSKASRGSALMIALVIVIITAGIGGAFLSQALIHSNEQNWSIEGDEATVMCDAGMERARQALGVYRYGNSAGLKWSWAEICQYCESAPAATKALSNDPPPPNNRIKNDANYYNAWRGEMKKYILADAKAMIKSTTFKGYAEASLATVHSTGAVTIKALDTVDTTGFIPGTPRVWSSAGAPSTTDGSPKILFGQTIPFGRGTLYIHVSAPLVSASPFATLDYATKDPENIVVTVTATLQSGVQRQVEAVLTKPVVKIAANGLAAIVSNDDVSTTGSIIVDGRDYDYSGTNVVGNGVFGIISNAPMSPITNGAVGGNGNAPPKPKGAAANSVQDSYDFSKTGGYPAGPDEALSVVSSGDKLKPGTLKQTAMDAGTYFATQTAFDTFVSKNGGKVPDGSIMYLEFTPGNGSFDLGSGNSKSSILVLHTDTNSGIAKEVHGNFTGLIMADGFVRNNGTSHIVGMIQLFSPTASTAGNVFGNGNAEIDFSSAALADLPGIGNAPSPAKVISYRRVQ